MLHYQILACTIYEKYKKSYKNIKFEISPPTWIEKNELPDGSCSVSDIQDYFDHIINKNEKVIENPLIRIYVNKIEKGLHLKLKPSIISKI